MTTARKLAAPAKAPKRAGAAVKPAAAKASKPAADAAQASPADTVDAQLARYRNMRDFDVTGRAQRRP